MKVLVTGNHGYVGTILTEELATRGHVVYGYDCDYYVDCILSATNIEPSVQVSKDIRDAAPIDFQGIDAVVHLAALSSDPLGELQPIATNEINMRGAVHVARCAQEAGVRRFVYVSSQSMYGISASQDELDEETSEKDPFTHYAKTKWEAECEIRKMNSDTFTVVCFRPSAVFGVSARLRCDIVYNYFVACAFTTKTIEVRSDGTPWRPIIHVRDLSNALIAGVEAPADLVAGESFNVGVENGNYSVRDLAESAMRVVPGSTLVYLGQHQHNERTYKVSFKKILQTLKDYYKPEWSLDRGGKELTDFFRNIRFTEDHFRGRICNRLPQIKHLIQMQELDYLLRRTPLQERHL